MNGKRLSKEMLQKTLADAERETVRSSFSLWADTETNH
jgi:hypothetical protein